MVNISICVRCHRKFKSIEMSKRGKKFLSKADYYFSDIENETGSSRKNATRRNKESGREKEREAGEQHKPMCRATLCAQVEY